VKNVKRLGRLRLMWHIPYTTVNILALKNSTNIGPWWFSKLHM